MIEVYMFTRIRKLSQKGKTIKQISKEVGMSKNTVAKYLKSNVPPKYSPRTKSTRIDPLCGFEEDIKGWLASSPNLTDQEIFELLKPKGYLGSIRTLNRRSKSYRPLKTPERFFEQVYAPGEQIQFDFKEDLTMRFVNKEQKVHLHIGSLPFSSRYHVKAYPFKTYQSYIDGIHSSFEFFEGITKNIRIDNLTACVSKILTNGERKYTKDFQNATEYYGWTVLPCNPARGNEKGHVERDIQTISRRIINKIALQKIIFKDWDHLNQWLKDEFWGLQNMNDPVFLKEKAALKPLAARSESILNKIDIVKPSPLGGIRINESTYSVPDALIFQECKVLLGAYTVTIIPLKPHPSIRDLKIVHPRQEKGINHICIEHAVTSLTRKPKAMLGWKHKAILFPHKTCTDFYNYLKKLCGYKAEQEYLKTLNLIHHISWDDLIACIELVMESKTNEPYMQVRNILLSHHSPQSDLKKSWLSQAPLHPDLSSYDRFNFKQGDKNA